MDDKGIETGIRVQQDQGLDSVGQPRGFDYPAGGRNSTVFGTIRVSRRSILIFGAPLVLLGVVAAVLAFGQDDRHAGTHPMPPPPEVSVARILERRVRLWDEFTGRIAAVESVELRPRVSGYVERIAFVEGQMVRKGDLLFVIDPRSYRAGYERAAAELARARSEAELARSQYARTQTLLAARAASREESDARAAAVAQSVAAVDAAEAAVARARLDLGFTEVRSPIDGRAGRAMVTVGNLAQADATVLTTVVSVDPVYVYFEGDEQAYLRDLDLAKSGKRPALGSPVRVGLANETGHPHAGRLDFVDNQVDPATGTIRARAVLANPDHSLTSGLFARVQVQAGREVAALLIDERAVLTDQDRKFVYVLGPGNTAVRRDIELGRRVDGLRIVRDGLAAGDQVIVHGVQKVFFAGMPVAPQPIAMGAPPRPAQRVAAGATAGAGAT